ncbi:MAG: ATP-binding cassette domain-containing protein [Alphaproteobacteria bacterium]|jgi:oligopeptide transport system ATP-binding protein|nr:ATP-binding cassette domain-containing protein [Alphaproteobacteria bacterium]
MNNVLSVNNLSVNFDVQIKKNFFFSSTATLKAVDKVSFNLQAEEIVGIVGESGCGKSTLVKAIMMLSDGHIDGDITINGKNVRGLSAKELKEVRKNIQIIFQDPLASLNPKMLIKDIIAEPLKVYYPELSKAEVMSRVFDIMEKVGLNKSVANRYAHEFSGGQCQRIGIARAMILNPKILICDESTSALDVSIKAQILNLLKDLKEQFKMSVLFISHDLSVIKYISDRILVFYLGNLVEVASSDDIYKHPKHPYTKSLISSIPGVKKEGRIILQGDIPSPLDLHLGCPFAGRCFKVQERCRIEKPALEKLSENSAVACFFADK